jgi:hypothetical protein
MPAGAERPHMAAGTRAVRCEATTGYRCLIGREMRSDRSGGANDGAEVRGRSFTSCAAARERRPRHVIERAASSEAKWNAHGLMGQELFLCVSSGRDFRNLAE